MAGRPQMDLSRGLVPSELLPERQLPGHSVAQAQPRLGRLEVLSGVLAEVELPVEAPPTGYQPMGRENTLGVDAGPATVCRSVRSALCSADERGNYDQHA